MTSADASRLGDELSELAAELIEAFAGDPTVPWPEQRFEALALRVFDWQFRSNPVYRRFAEGRGAVPGKVRSWEEVPAVPASAFKHLHLLSGPPGRIERVFRTSGTTATRRGEHPVPLLALYRASLLPTFRAYVLPDGKLPFLSLVPSQERQPDSSLSTMIGEAASVLGAEGGGWFAEGDGLDLERLERALRDAEAAGRPVLLVGAAFAFVHWLDALDASGAPPFRLAPGSRVLETGGFKGRSRVVPREELYEALTRRLGIGVEWIVNEYGMTELLSQYYEPGIGRAHGGTLAEALEARRHVGPPWLRFRILDPATLEPVPDGERGIVAHFDLANVGSVSAILTEDFGWRDARGLKLLGRAPGAEPRGCSIAMDELLGAPRA